MSRMDDAKAILSVPLFATLIQEMEQVAVNKIAAAKPDEHEVRRDGASDIRAIRNLRSRLEAISNEGQSSERKKAPA
jgi:hypothetical protein